MKLKLNNIRNILFVSTIFFSGFTVYSNIESLAYSENIDLTNRSIVRNFGGYGIDILSSVTQTLDGGLIVVGGSTSTNTEFTNKGSEDAIIIKYDKYGSQQWVKSFGGSNDDRFNSVIKTSDKGFVTVGHSSSTDTDFANKGGTDAIIIKYDEDGNQQWIKSFGGSGTDSFNSVVEASDEGLIVIGESNSHNAGFINRGGDDAIIIKYDKYGNEEWTKHFGGSNNDFFYSVIEISDEGIVVAGYSYSTDTDFINKGDADGIIIKYDKDGNQQWIKSFGGLYNDTLYSVIETSDKGLIVVGDSYSDGIGFDKKGSYDAIIVKYDKDGNQQWVKNFGGSLPEMFFSIIETPDKGFVAVGSSFSFDAEFNNKGFFDAIIVKYNEHCKSNESEFISVSNFNKIGRVTKKDFDELRTKINKIDDEEVKRYLNEKLNKISVDLNFELKNSSSNLDVYIKSENMLSLSLDTNSIAFEDFSGVEDMEKANAINLTVNSSLPYEVNAYLVSEIQNSDKSNTMNKDILNIKANSEVVYNTFTDTTTPIALLDNQPKGNDITHGIDIKLKGGIAHEKDVYKTTIKFEVKQK